MRLFERFNDQDNNNSGNGNPESSDQLQRARAQGDRLLAAGDDVIRRALSGNSQNFLREGRQQGGQ